MADPLSAVRHGYDQWSAIYDRDGNPLQALEEPIVRAAVGAVEGLNVLDIGCGTGRHTIWLASMGAAVTTVDFSEGILAEARRKPGTAGIRFMAHDLHQPLPFDSEFELIVSGLVLEHLQAPEGYFREAHRVLKPRGRAVISAMHPAVFLRGTQARFTDPITGELVNPGSLPHSISAFVMAAVRAGFLLAHIAEYSPEAVFAAGCPQAQKYIRWPMLVVLTLNRPETG